MTIRSNIVTLYIVISNKVCTLALPSWLHKAVFSIYLYKGNNMLNKLKKKLESTEINDSDLEQAWDSIRESNRKMVIFLCLMFSGAILFLLIFVSMFPVSLDDRHIPVFIFSLLSAAIILVIAVIGKTSRTATMVATYLTIASVMLYGIIVSYGNPHGYTVAFIALVGIISMTFVDKPSRIGLAIIIGTIVCIAMSLFSKEKSIRMTDVMNILSFSAISLVLGCFTIKSKLNSYIISAKMKHLSEKDILTELYNRNSFEQWVNDSTNNEIRSLGCIYVDVNGLHEINNARGHKAGDEMLQFVASAMRDEFGADDTYRIGGDEFAAFVLDTNKAEILKKIDRMKSVITSSGYHIAIGFEYSEGEVSISSTVEIAEQKMRKDKRNFYADNPIDYNRDCLRA